MKDNSKYMTERLQKLVKKRKTQTVVIKAGSIKFNKRQSESGTDYIPSSFANN